MRICAATVAYDNPVEFERLLRCLESQSYLDGLLVIDNSSQAYAADNAATFRSFSPSYQFADYVRTEENIGSAAAFCIAMKMAHEKGFDWVWLLDQDGTVEPGCLASLLQNVAQADILCPKIVDIVQPEIILPQSGGIENPWGRVIGLRSVTQNRNISYFATHGVLISKEVLDRVGYYDARHFFVGSEDYDYAFRATAQGLRILLVVNAEARHPDIALRGAEKVRSLIEQGVIGSLSSEAEVTGKTRFHRSVFNRLRSRFSQRIADSLPEHLGYVSRKVAENKTCRRQRAVASLSHAYLATKRLTGPQLTAAVLYSLFVVSLRRIIGDSRISLRKTLRAYSVCMLSKLGKTWPFESVEEFCLCICQ